MVCICGFRFMEIVNCYTLSPYLFLFVADALFALLRNEIGDQTISPIKVTRNAPGLSHLLFANDSLLFFKADQMQSA